MDQESLLSGRLEKVTAETKLVSVDLILGSVAFYYNFLSKWLCLAV